MASMINTDQITQGINAMNKEKWFVYIIECEDGSLYTGATNNLERRFSEHKAGKGSKYVLSRKAVKLVFSEECHDKYQAYQREREIKGFSRQKKLELIELNLSSAPR
jgi:putative endonuclease